MRQHFLKRFLILLPSAWLIASVVFLLGKMMPGSASEAEFENAAENALGAVKTELRQKSIVELRHRSGQDLPLFYVGFGTLAEPDTLFRVFPETDRLALQHLVRDHGNWPLVSAFYRDVKDLQALSLTIPGSSGQFRDQVGSLLQQHPDEQERATFSSLKAVDAQPVLRSAILRTERSYVKLQISKPGWGHYVPALHWHGTRNQYHRWFSELLRGSLGISSRDSRPVVDVLFEAFSLTFTIACASLVLTAFLALELALFLNRKSVFVFRRTGLSFLYSLESIPLYLFALLALALAGGISDSLGLSLPIACLVLANLPYLTAQLDVSLQKVQEQPYLLAARAKGFSEGKVLRKQALRPAILPVITVLSDFFPALLAGSLVLEVVFSLPGMGRLLLDSVLARDYNVLAGIVLLTGGLKILSHLLADILAVLADPRLRQTV